jgi:hypothetical protein
MDVMIDNMTTLASGLKHWSDPVNAPPTRRPVVRRQITRILGDLNLQVRQTSATAKDIVRFFESGDDARAHEELPELLASVRILFTVFSQDLGWVESPDAEVPQEQFSPTLERALRQLIKAGENRSWISICDALEYEIVPLLESWQKTVEKTHARVN